MYWKTLRFSNFSVPANADAARNVADEVGKSESRQRAIDQMVAVAGIGAHKVRADSVAPIPLLKENLNERTT